jgi:hypothetical protein
MSQLMRCQPQIDESDDQALTTISYLPMSKSASSAAGDKLCFVWDSSKGKSAGSDLLLTYKRYYDLVHNVY